MVTEFTERRCFDSYGDATQRGPWPPHFWRFLGHSRRTTVGRTPLDEWTARQRDLYLTTHNTQQSNIHALGGIRTHDLSERAAADLRLKPRGYWDRRTQMYELILSSRNTGSFILRALITHQTPNFRNRNMLFWRLIFLLKVNHISCKKMIPWKNMLNNDSWNHLLYRLLASHFRRNSRCVAVVLHRHTTSRMVALWIEALHTEHWTPNRKKFLCIYSL